MHFELFETLSCKLLYLSQRSQIDATSMFSSLPVNTIVSPWPHSTASEPKVRILGFNFSLNPLRFSLIRETDTKMGTYLVPKPKSRAIGKINNNWIDAKYHQMAFRLAGWCCSQAFFGRPLVKQKLCKCRALEDWLHSTNVAVLLNLQNWNS